MLFQNVQINQDDGRSESLLELGVLHIVSQLLSAMHNRVDTNHTFAFNASSDA